MVEEENVSYKLGDIVYKLNGQEITFSDIKINGLNATHNAGSDYVIMSIDAEARTMTVEDDSFILGECKCGCGKLLPTIRTKYSYLKIRLKGHKKIG